jgi:hypothetical protein
MGSSLCSRPPRCGGWKIGLLVAGEPGAGRQRHLHVRRACHQDPRAFGFEQFLQLQGDPQVDPFLAFATQADAVGVGGGGAAVAGIDTDSSSCE